MLQVVSKAIDISLAKVRLTMMVNINRCVRMFFSVKLAKAAVGCYVLHVCLWLNMCCFIPEYIPYLVFRWKSNVGMPGQNSEKYQKSMPECISPLEAQIIALINEACIILLMPPVSYSCAYSPVL